MWKWIIRTIVTNWPLINFTLLLSSVKGNWWYSGRISWLRCAGIAFTCRKPRQDLPSRLTSPKRSSVRRICPRFRSTFLRFIGRTITRCLFILTRISSLLLVRCIFQYKIGIISSRSTSITMMTFSKLLFISLHFRIFFPPSSSYSYFQPCTLTF